MIGQPALAAEAVDAAQHMLITSVDDGPRPLIEVAFPGTQPGTEAAVFGELAVQLDRAQRRITVCGELDMATVRQLADVLALLPDSHPGEVTIDLTGVSFIDAAGLGCLVGFADRLAARGAKLSVVGASVRLRRVFDIVHLGGLLQAS